MMNKRMVAIAFAAMAIGLSPAWAQDSAAPAKRTGETEAMPGMDHGKMGHGGASPPEAAAKSDTGAGGGMDHGSMQGGSPPPDARDPHAYSGGYDFGPIPRPRMGDEDNYRSLLVDRLESVRTRDNTYTSYDLLAWFGRDYDRLWFKADGEVDGGKFQDARTELLWGHAVAAYWDTQLGVRYDSGLKPDRRWLAVGFQGLAPYWFEIEATAYVGEQGRTAFRFEAEYELLLTQKLILQPRIEANFYGKSDAARELGSGLSDAVTGVRLRYEIRREFAPYVGIEWAGKYGGTADHARAAGERTRKAQLVAGLRFWF